MILHCEDQHKKHVSGVNCVSTKAKIPEQKKCVSNRPCAASEILINFVVNLISFNFIDLFYYQFYYRCFPNVSL